ATGTPVQPVGLRFADAQHEVSAAAAYVGDTSLLQSVGMIVAASGLRVVVTWLPAEPTAQADRRVLGERLRERIGQALNVKEFRSAA
ncbi:MAG TPA: 1-acyl-sn-glycerol-3-phosphate acyltransferase, partial [Albitalea sp.]|nr:1-acyl-sn-glycerol-3-phosphate acyltransferase [Albitalea sp.]